MPAKLIIADDYTGSLALAVQAAARFPQLTLDHDLSAAIENLAGFERLAGFLSRSSESLILVLDLNFDFDPEDKAVLRKRYPAFADLEESILDGPCLAAAAIANPNERDLLIIIATQRQHDYQLTNHLENAIRKGPNLNRIQLEFAGRPFFSADSDPEMRLENACHILERATKRWREFPSATPRLKLLARDLFRGTRHATVPHQIGSQLFPELWGENTYVDSFKALYWIDEARLNRFAEDFDRLQRRPCAARVVQVVLEYLKITLSLDGIAQEERIQLPIQPGLLFILNLGNFLEGMEIYDAVLGKVGSLYEMRIRLRIPVRFRNAVLTNTGRDGARRFYELIACANKVLQESLEDNSDIDKVRDQWPPRPFLNPGSDDPGYIYRAVLEWDVKDDRLTLRWKDNLPKP